MEPNVAPGQIAPSVAMPGGDKFAEAILAQTETILADKLFAKSPQLRRFLRFAVERTLTGEGMRLKEYTIAVEALGRPESFDARLDSIVRVEARRLREKLETYYETKGTTDRVVIRLEPGKYIPLFLDRIGGSADTAITLRIGLLQSAEEALDRISSAIESLGYAVRPIALDRVASDAANFDVLIAPIPNQELSRAVVSQARGLLGAFPGLVFVLSPESMREVIGELFSVNAEWIVQPVRVTDLEVAIKLALHRRFGLPNSHGTALFAARSHTFQC